MPINLEKRFPEELKKAPETAGEEEAGLLSCGRYEIIRERSRREASISG